MKKILFFLAAVLLFGSCDKLKKVKTTDRYNSYKEVRDNFYDPPAEYRTMPFWVWNEKVNREMIDNQLEGFKENGIGGVFVHPRYGLITEYASEEWYELVKYAKEKAASLDMELWLYDENSFPSGFAGGLVPAQMPESYQNGIAMKKHEMTIFKPDTSLSWIAFFKKEGENYKDISGEYEKHLGMKGDYMAVEKVFYEPSKWFGGYTYVDLIHPGVTEKFIEITMSGYEKTIGEDFGGVVPGIFTDEPNISPRGRGNLRWTSDLFDVFEKTWGYDLEENIPSLFVETGDWKRIRHNYYSVLLDLFIERWSIPWNEYTEEKGLKWTGHYWEHGWPDPVHGGDNMAMYPYHQVPGIDMLFNTRSERPDQFGNVRAVKELSSVANQFGRSRTLSETYGASGYELDFEDMKRNGDWQYALGVNFMNQHLAYQSMLGDRKHDFPQTFSYHTPWWDEYRGQADYFARLSMALASGYQVNNILVIEPTTSAWMYYVPSAENTEMKELDKDFSKFIGDMEYQKLEYDLASEKTMRDFGNSADGLMVVGERSYNTLVLPPGLSNIDRSTLSLISTFLKDGGKLVSFVGAPLIIDGKESNEMKELFGKYTGQIENASTVASSSLPGLPVSMELNFSPLDAAESVYFMRRQMSDGELLFVANYEEGNRKEFAISASLKSDVVELDLVSGNIYKLNYEKTGDGIRFNVQLEDAGSRLYFISETRIKGKKEEREIWTAEREEELFISGIQRVDPNVIVLDYCYLEFPGQEEPSDELLYFYQAHDRIFRKYGFPDNPWVSSSQFKTEIVDRDTFGNETGFKVSFPLSINEGTDLSSLQLVVERPELYSVFVNDKKLEALEGEYYMDMGTGVFPAGEALKPGRNMINLVAQPFSVFHELAPVFVKGNFTVQPSEKGWELYQEVPLSLGSWKSYGMPFYPGEVAYYARFEMENTLKAKLFMNDWNATCVTVSVNGSEDQLLWTPYEMDISQWLKKGENDIKITLNGSLKNLVGPHHNVSRKGIVTPWSFKYAPDEMPAGIAYDLVEYGLFSPPVIRKTD